MLIKDNNREIIDSIITEAEGRAKARTICYTDINHAIVLLEESLGIPKKAMVGVTADIDMNAQDFPKAYKYRPESTHFTVIRKPSGWDLTKVFRDTTRRYNHRFHVELTDAAKQSIIDSKCCF